MLKFMILISFGFCLKYITATSTQHFPFTSTPILKTRDKRSTFMLEFCEFAYNRICPDPDINFFSYSQQNPDIGEQVFVGSNDTFNRIYTFDPRRPTKIIIHGYNSNMFLRVLEEIKSQYLRSMDVNVILIDWSNISKGPCYPAAVWNLKLVGKCAAQLVQKVIEAGSHNIHIIGFSLGAHAAGYIAGNLRPFRISRITGLDPAMPGFITVNNENKLDSSDADFVDILHTNAFVQGTAQPIGHVDYYINGGMVQPGCWAETRFFACNHHRAPLYFAESINTKSGFWGWHCSSYTNFLLGHCKPNNPQIIMGEHAQRHYRGIYLVITNSVSPFAVGKYNGPIIEIFKNNSLNNTIY